jgi:hypothetical protein
MVAEARLKLENFDDVVAVPWAESCSTWCASHNLGYCYTS